MTLSAMMWRLRDLKVRERNGDRNHPAIQWAHELCRLGESVADEVPWCSSVVNLAAALTFHRRSESAAARSWLNAQLGILVTNPDLFRETLTRMQRVHEKNGVLVFRRGAGRGQLGADVLDAPGHVAVFDGYQTVVLPDHVDVIGGNQGNAMTVQRYPIADLLGILVVAAEI